ncbi:MAG TPA: hypothetical protein PLU37_03350 [Chitinophagaceae bacterium]|nr:hypothetical protein [Chitinophagaceae bacterium]MCB9056680.1 hypothetical protein [Chitinophagales bacterium]HPG10540.1 hypothetical protein [Chitinophagaceae bacterium]
MASTIIGTISHEAGHYITAKALGYHARINYMSTIDILLINGKLTDPKERMLITLGGPVQTILTGTIGLVLLFFFRRSFQSASKLNLKQWLIIFITLFWLRQTANFVIWVSNYFINGQFLTRGDEVKLARYFGLPEATIVTITALAGAIILFTVIFKFIPIAQRFTFILAGLFGGIAGYLLWFGGLGEMIMP